MRIFATISIILLLTIELFPQELNVSIETDKNLFLETEIINVFIEIKNISKKDLLMLPFDPADEGCMDIIMKDSTGKTLPPGLISSSFKFPEYNTLRPNEIEFSIYNLTRNYSTIYDLNCGMHYILAGKYKLQVIYHHTYPDLERNLLVSKHYESNEIEFEVKKPINKLDVEAFNEIKSGKMQSISQEKYIAFKKKYKGSIYYQTIFHRLIEYQAILGIKDIENCIKDFIETNPDSFISVEALMRAGKNADALYSSLLQSKIEGKRIEKYYKKTKERRIQKPVLYILNK